MFYRNPVIFLCMLVVIIAFGFLGCYTQVGRPGLNSDDDDYFTDRSREKYVDRDDDDRDVVIQNYYDNVEIYGWDSPFLLDTWWYTPSWRYRVHDHFWARHNCWWDCDPWGYGRTYVSLGFYSDPFWDPYYYWHPRNVWVYDYPVHEYGGSGHETDNSNIINRRVRAGRIVDRQNPREIGTLDNTARRNVTARSDEDAVINSGRRPVSGSGDGVLSRTRTDSDNQQIGTARTSNRTNENEVIDRRTVSVKNGEKNTKEAESGSSVHKPTTVRQKTNSEGQRSTSTRERVSTSRTRSRDTKSSETTTRKSDSNKSESNKSESNKSESSSKSTPSYSPGNSSDSGSSGKSSGNSGNSSGNSSSRSSSSSNRRSSSSGGSRAR